MTRPTMPTLVPARPIRVVRFVDTMGERRSCIKLVQLRNRFQGFADPYMSTRYDPSLSFCMGQRRKWSTKEQLDTRSEE